MFVVALLFTQFLVPSLAENNKCVSFPYAILENGNITVIGQNKLRFQCHEGYFLTSPAVIRCRKGVWSFNRQPRCLRSEGQCDDPPPIENGEVSGKSRREGSSVFYMCNPGYVLLGQEIRRCLQSGHWGGITPQCLDESEPLLKVAERLKHKFVSDLIEQSDNSSTPDGRLLDPESIHNGLELVFLIDRSSSIDPHDFKIGINFVKGLLEEFNIKNGVNATGTRAAVFPFGSKVDILFNLDDYVIESPEIAAEVLDTLEASGGGTAMETALTNVFTYLDEPRERAKKAIFLMTDGIPNMGTPGITPEDVARQLKEYGGFEIFTMGIGRGINRTLLTAIASEPPLSHVFILDKYSDLNNITKMIKNAPPKPKPVSADRCGYIKGEDLYLKKWPWLAAIYSSDANGTLTFCTGTLICSQWVLTSASCIKSKEAAEQETKAVFIVMGEHTIIQKEPYEMNFFATRIILHPQFDSSRKFKNNLALLHLNTPVPRNKFRPACLPPTDRTIPLHISLNLNVSIAGWGLQMPSINYINGGTLNVTRTTVPVELAEKDECKRITGRAFTDEIFCAGFGKNTCIGDVGSPIVGVDPATHLHHVLGALSGKKKCGGRESYNQYTELTRHLQWIHKATENCQRAHWMA